MVRALALIEELKRSRLKHLAGRHDQQSHNPHREAGPTKEPWQMTQSEILGSGPTLNEARNWNEDEFLYSDMRPGKLSAVFHEGPLKAMYWNGDTVISKNQYALADDREYDRTLLMARTVDQQGKELIEWGPVGEYTGGNLGVLAAYQGEGAGTAFVKELMQRGKWKPSIGYSPEGRKTASGAHKKVVAQALREGKNVPESVLADYPDLKENYE